MLDFNTDYILENEIVLLRPLKENDFAALLEYAENEPDNWQYNALGPNNANNLKTYITTALNNKANKTEYPFVVYHKQENKLVGSTRFYNINLYNKTLEIGYTWYGKKYQGTPVNKNCKFLLLQFAFETVQMERVGFRANKLNTRSINAMKSIGCVEEGVLRNFAFDAKGNRIDSIVLSIIKSEWFNGVKEKLITKIALKN